MGSHFIASQFSDIHRCKRLLLRLLPVAAAICGHSVEGKEVKSEVNLRRSSSHQMKEKQKKFVVLSVLFDSLVCVHIAMCGCCYGSIKNLYDRISGLCILPHCLWLVSG
jgi:hypothetical protein